MSGTWILDSEALSRYLRADRKMTARLAAALEDDIRVVISAVTIVEPIMAESIPHGWLGRCPG